MQNPPPFIPRGLTIALAITASAQAMALPKLAARGGEIRIANIGTQTVFLVFTGVANLTDSMPLIGNSVEVFSCLDGTVLSVIAAATGSTLYVTVGEGV